MKSAGETIQVQQEIFLKHSLDKVWWALTDAAQFGDWFGADFNQIFIPHGRFRGLIRSRGASFSVDGEKQGQPFIELHIEKIVERRLFTFHWHSFVPAPGQDYSSEPRTLVSFSVEESGDGVALTLTESGFEKMSPAKQPEAMSASEQGWTKSLNRLHDYLN